MRQVGCCNRQFVAQDGRMFNHVGQFPDITWPAIVAHHVQGIIGERIFGKGSGSESPHQMSSNSRMSSMRSRKGGSRISKVLMRYIKSCRKSPSSTIFERSRWVAQTMRTSTLKGWLWQPCEFHHIPGPVAIWIVWLWAARRFHRETKYRNQRLQTVLYDVRPPR